MAETKESGLLETFRRLDAGAQTDVLAIVRVAYAAQENTKRRYGIQPEKISAQNQPKQEVAV